MKNIIITGGSGFIGGSLIAQLVPKYRVVALDRNTDCDLLHPIANPKTFKGVDVVIHLASMTNVGYSIVNPGEVMTNNLAMCVNLLEAIRLSGRRPLCIFSSSDRIYGNASHPIEPYTASKVLGETVFRTYSALYDIPHIIFRLDAVYGPNQPRRMFIADVIQKMLVDDRIVVGQLDAYRNFVHIEDVAGAFLKAINAPRRAWNRTYDIGGRECVSLRQMLFLIKNKIEKKLSKKIDIQVDKSLLARRSGTEMAVPFSLAIKKTTQALGWRPRLDLDKGLDNTINWFLQYAKK